MLTSAMLAFVARASVTAEVSAFVASAARTSSAIYIAIHTAEEESAIGAEAHSPAIAVPVFALRSSAAWVAALSAFFCRASAVSVLSALVLSSEEMFCHPSLSFRQENQRTDEPPSTRSKPHTHTHSQNCQSREAHNNDLYLHGMLQGVRQLIHLPLLAIGRLGQLSQTRFELGARGALLQFLVERGMQIVGPGLDQLRHLPTQ